MSKGKIVPIISVKCLKLINFRFCRDEQSHTPSNLFFVFATKIPAIA